MAYTVGGVPISLVAGFVGLVWLVRKKLIAIYVTPIVALRGPPSPSILYGNFQQLGKVADPTLLQKWMDDYGPTFLARLFILMPCLWTADPRAINHIITQSGKYFKPRDGRKQAAQILGESLIIAEGESHKRMRRVMNPAFGPAQVRELTSIFVEKATELREYWKSAMVKEGGTLRVNVIEDLSKTTLDVIGLAGFDHNLDSLKPGSERKELNAAIRHLFKKPPNMTVFRVLLDYAPWLNLFPDERLRNLIEAQKVMRRVARQLIEDKKAAIKASSEDDEHVGRGSVHGRDLLTLLIKANMASDIPVDQRLSDDEVLSQIPTFLLAGHETTSVATTWALYALSESPRIQRKLREELLAVPTETPTMEDLHALPYLDQFVHETLRLYPPVTNTMRAANEDDVIPLGEPIIDKKGNVLHEIPVAKGTRIVIPILAVHRSKAIWGEDALEFKPERWENLPETVSSVPGVWGHLLTFLGGPHGCIGYRFSVTELKALLFALVREFEFELAVPHGDIVPMGLLVQRPVVRNELNKGSQMPMIIRPYQPS
ncbi:cytochrome P450 [Dichomitus squalens LYAD-421 SS1]|uniref:Cytochrome P450 n=1 Tax=Dichomitus squalens (strain LYAD-421) TaxID=732165 RepID=R7SR62_DICSQ|nr:cytochrome P450 [Dichomitus squalens LYAD-421 SS1]EJF57472.1 cytochrome P450 [Dichomitus squalens LYAD-421 SS1]